MPGPPRPAYRSALLRFPLPRGLVSGARGAAAEWGLPGGPPGKRLRRATFARPPAAPRRRDLWAAFTIFRRSPGLYGAWPPAAERGARCVGPRRFSRMKISWGKRARGLARACPGRVGHASPAKSENVEGLVIAMGSAAGLPFRWARFRASRSGVEGVARAQLQACDKKYYGKPISTLTI